MKIFKTKRSYRKALLISGIVLLALYILCKVSFKPYDVEVTSQTSGGFTVSWRTTLPSIGNAYVSESEFSIPIISSIFHSKFKDERDQTEAVGLYRNHSVNVSGLEPESEYFVHIGTSVIRFQHNDVVTTAKEVGELMTPSPSWGYILEGEEENTVSDSIITL